MEDTNIEEIDFTEQQKDENQQEIDSLTQEINRLENTLKYPLGFKNAVAGGLLGYLLTKKNGKRRIREFGLC